jgi:acylphosphatase
LEFGAWNLEFSLGFGAWDLGFPCGCYSPPIATRLRITGLVQGVFFRASAAHQAVKLGLCGWVRNMEDGSVEAHVQGEESAIQEFAGWCRQGPEGAKVEDVQMTEMPDESRDRFDILR